MHSLTIELLLGARRSGKTTSVIAWLAENPKNRVVICHSYTAARFLEMRAQVDYPGSGIRARNFVTPRQQIHLRGRGQETEFAVDDLDLVLTALLGVRPSLATSSDITVKPVPTPGLQQ